MSDVLHHFAQHNLEASDIALSIGLAVLSILALASFFGYFSLDSHSRLRIIERHRNNLRAASVRRGRTQQTTRHTGPSAFISTHIKAIFPAQIVKEKMRLLRSAGFSHNWSFAAFFVIKGISLFVLLLCLFYLAFTGALTEPTARVFIFLFSLSLFVFFAIDFFIRWKRKTRLKRLERGLPDCLDLLVICAEAGLSLDAGLKRVAEEFVAAVPELSEELLLTSVELNFLPDRRQALANLAFRVDIAAFRGVTTALIQTEKYGTPLAQALRMLSNEFRETRLLEAEEKAARLPAILTVPMICFILPALFVVLAGPAFIKVSGSIG